MGDVYLFMNIAKQIKKLFQLYEHDSCKSSVLLQITQTLTKNNMSSSLYNVHNDTDGGPLIR